MSWGEDNLLQFMQVHSKFFGREIEQITAARFEWVQKTFTKKLFEYLRRIDFYQVYKEDYIVAEYEGKGDIRDMRLRDDFALTTKQCVDIANYIAGRMDKLGSIDVFAILKYIDFGLDLRTNYISILDNVILRMVEKGGEEE